MLSALTPPTAAVAPKAASHLAGVPSPTRSSTPWNTSSATADSTAIWTVLKIVLIGLERRHSTQAASTPSSRPTPKSTGVARNNPRTRGTSLSETACASRRTWMCTTKRSAAADSTATTIHDMKVAGR
jgi:hypothetical protein